MSTKEIVSTELQEVVKSIVSDKLESFLMTCLDDCQDTITEDIELVLGFEHGILPPRFVELQREMETIMEKYLIDNVLIDELQK